MRSLTCLVLLTFSFIAVSLAQQASTTAVPNLINFSGTLVLSEGVGVPAKMVGVTFAIYRQQDGGAPLWLETQNVTPDSSGHYTVLLGSTKAEGIPAELFNTKEQLWLGVQMQGEAEQPRVLLVSVPYAMKAADAETIGGLPASAFVLAAPPNANPAIATTPSEASGLAAPPTSSNVTTTGGTANTIPLFTTPTNIQNSILTQTGTKAVNVGGKLNLPATGTATASKGFNSQPGDFVASVFNSGTSTAVPQTFQWQAEPVNNDKTTASGTLNLLFGQGTGLPTETGLKINSKGVLSFATGQTFPGTGTVTSVGLSAPSSDFTVSGSPVTSAGTLALGWNVAPTNANTPNAIVKRDPSGNFSAAAITAASFSGSGAGVTNVNATQLGGLGSGAYAQLAAANTFTASQTIQGSLGVGNSNSYITLQTVGQDATGTGIQNVTTNTSKSQNSFAVFAATSSAGVTAELVADGIGTGPMGTPGGYFGTFTNQPIGFITGNTERMRITPQGAVTMTSSANDVFGISVNASHASAAEFIGGTDAVGLGGDGLDVTAGLQTTGNGQGGIGVVATGGNNNDPQGQGGDGIFATAGSGSIPGFAGEFNGDVTVGGHLSKSSGSFKIDHPLDPANKYLYHSFVESPDMKNIYDGNVVLDGSGEAVVALPEWFGTLNRDFRYQLTCIGGFAPVYIAEEILNNQFKIAGGKSGMKISWQVTGIRQDAWANAHRIPVEVQKSERERGYYIHPELYGAPEEKSIAWARHPQLMKRMRERSVPPHPANKFVAQAQALQASR